MNKKIKVLFINPPSRVGRIAIVPPIGILYLAAVLLKKGIEVEVYDSFLNKSSDADILKRISGSDYGVLALTGMSANYEFIQWISSEVKKIHGNIPIIAGGHVASCMPEYFLKHTEVDACCTGEGEVMIADLVRNIYNKKSLANIPNLAYKENGKIIFNRISLRTADLDSLPLPAYNLINVPGYLENRSELSLPNLVKFAKRKNLNLKTISPTWPVITQRGCPYACSFCSKNYGEKSYRNSVDNVINHFKYLNKIYGINNFKFSDEVFNISSKWIIEFCRRIKEEELPFYFYSSANRANLMKEDVVELLEATNFYQLSIGIESFNQEVLDEMNKRLKVEVVINAIEMLNKYHLMAYDCIIMFGWSRDTKQTMKENLRWIKKLKLNDVGIFFPTPFPQTELYDKAESMEKIGDFEKYLHLLSRRNLGDLSINISKFTDNELKKIVAIAQHKIIIYRSLRELRFIAVFRHYLGIIYQVVKFKLIKIKE